MGGFFFEIPLEQRFELFEQVMLQIFGTNLGLMGVDFEVLEHPGELVLSQRLPL